MSMFYLAQQWMEQVMKQDEDFVKYWNNIPSDGDPPDGLENADPVEPTPAYNWPNPNEEYEFTGLDEISLGIIDGQKAYAATVQDQITDAYDDNMNPGQQEEPDEQPQEDD